MGQNDGAHHRVQHFGLPLKQLVLVFSVKGGLFVSEGSFCV